MNESLVELRNITKYFAKVIANNNISLSIRKGEVLALLGENGAGKSTIMKILYGLYQAEEGKIEIDNIPVKISSPKDAMNRGIGMIQQHFSLVPRHTVTENIILGNIHGFIDTGKLTREIKELSDNYGFDIDPSAYVKDLPVGVQQKVEILKALYQNVQLLIMDEPTAVLTPQEAEKLMDFVRKIADDGKSVVFITHKLKEVMYVSDRVVVMRNGEVIGDLPKEKTNEEELSSLMVGKEIPDLEKRTREMTETAFEVKNLTAFDVRGHKVLDNISFNIEKGEIFAIAGVSGNGQQELGESIAGILEAETGDILLEGSSIRKLSIRERIEKGIGYVHADRHQVGLVLGMSIAENMFLKGSYNKSMSRFSVINNSALMDYTRRLINDYSIKASGPEEPARGLSGGNQQKIVVAREVGIGSKLIVFDQPTRGLDIGAINYVHKTILAERSKGKCILLISTELSEIFALADRIGVIYNGSLLKVINRKDATLETIGLLMAGITTEGMRE